MFMHASWSHIIGNMIFFWAFGRRWRKRWDGFASWRSTWSAACGDDGAGDGGAYVAGAEPGASGAIAAVMAHFW